MGTLYDPTLTQFPFANKDISVSFDWYRKAGEHGLAAAQITLGQSYQTGWGVAQNITKAAEWFRKAAQQGVPSAQNQIGWMTAHGQGVAKDCAVAKNWFESAKAGGYARAEGNLHSGAGGACQW
jgi:TPR repeat protein